MADLLHCLQQLVDRLPQLQADEALAQALRSEVKLAKDDRCTCSHAGQGCCRISVPAPAGQPCAA